MTNIEMLKEANGKVKEIIAHFTAKAELAPDVVAERTEELSQLKKDELISMIIKLEAPKVKRAFTVEDVVRQILEEKSCALFTYKQIAEMVHRVVPEGNTSSKSIATYASKRKDIWNIIPRQKFNLTLEDLMEQAV